MSPRNAVRSQTRADESRSEGAFSSWIGAGGMLLLVIALYLALKQTGLFSLTSSVEGTIGLGTIFVIGLIAATSSCLAVVGGLLLSIGAQWADAYRADNRWEKFRPLFLFNMGRLAGYFVLGGLTGLLGKSLTLSIKATGILTLLIAVVMVVLGLNILRILPKQYCRIPLPRSLMRRLQALSQSENLAAPLTLGALTFFLPCGFTQSMQLLALGTGSFLLGGTIMLTFALGTLPSLLGISVLSSMLEGRPARLFIRFSGAVVLLLGLANVQSGLLLMGYDPSSLLPAFARNTSITPVNDPYVSIDPQGRQIMSMYVTSGGYSPSNFTIRPGLETWIYAIAPKGVTGCATFLVDATHNLETPIRQGSNWLGPIKDPKNDFVLTCSAGILRANVHVQPS